MDLARACPGCRSFDRAACELLPLAFLLLFFAGIGPAAEQRALGRRPCSNGAQADGGVGLPLPPVLLSFFGLERLLGESGFPSFFFRYTGVGRQQCTQAFGRFLWRTLLLLFVARPAVE